MATEKVDPMPAPDAGNNGGNGPPPYPPTNPNGNNRPDGDADSYPILIRSRRGTANGRFKSPVRSDPLAPKWNARRQAYVYCGPYLPGMDPDQTA